MDGTRYFYEVRPQKPVRIPGKRATIVRQSLLLTKDEVKEYMKSGPVYRKSTKGQLIKVTGANLDSLHRSLDGEVVTGKELNVHVQTVQRNVAHQQQGNSYQQPGSGKNQNWNGKKKNRHNRGNNNYSGDERGKTSVNNNPSQPQFNNMQQNTEDGNNTPVVAIP